jgi:translation initiation factor 2B subunit (eIF-2B alpha/beta/delta family)
MSVFAESLEEACVLLRRRQIEGALPCAKKTAELMRILVTQQRHADAASLIDEVRAVGHRLQSSNPTELVIGNIVRRVLHMIREEAQHDVSEAAESTASAAPAHAEPKEELAQAEVRGEQGRWRMCACMVSACSSGRYASREEAQDREIT